jgi:hypothetical protein
MIQLVKVRDHFYRADVGGNRAIWFIDEYPIAYRGISSKVRVSENMHGPGFEPCYLTLAGTLHRMDRVNFESCLEDEFGG